MNTTLDLSQIIIPESKILQDSLYKSISGDIVWKICNLDKPKCFSISHIRNRYEETGVKASPVIYGWLYEILRNVKKTLKMEGDVDLYIV